MTNQQLISISINIEHTGYIIPTIYATIPITITSDMSDIESPKGIIARSNALIKINNFIEKHQEIKENAAVEVLIARADEFLKNSVDAKANLMTIGFRIEPEKNEIYILIADNGKGTQDVIKDYDFAKAFGEYSVKTEKTELGGANKGLAMPAHYLSLQKGALRTGAGPDGGYLVELISSNQPKTFDFITYEQAMSEDIKFYDLISAAKKESVLAQKALAGAEKNLSIALKRKQEADLTVIKKVKESLTNASRYFFELEGSLASSKDEQKFFRRKLLGPKEKFKPEREPSQEISVAKEQNLKKQRPSRLNLFQNPQESSQSPKRNEDKYGEELEDGKSPNL